MKTRLITAPSAKPISVAELRSHCRIDTDDDDIYISGIIEAAVAHVENITGRKLITQTWDLYLDNWPGGAEFELPFGKLQSVASITYKNQAGESTEWDSADYIVDTDSFLGRVVIGYDKSWPSDSLYNVNPITVRFVCGYGTAADVPASLKHAVKLLAAHWYENREPVVVGSITANIPMTVDALIWPHRIFGW